MGGISLSAFRAIANNELLKDDQKVYFANKSKTGLVCTLNDEPRKITSDAGLAQDSINMRSQLLNLARRQLGVEKGVNAEAFKRLETQLLGVGAEGREIVTMPLTKREIAAVLNTVTEIKSRTSFSAFEAIANDQSRNAIEVIHSPGVDARNMTSEETAKDSAYLRGQLLNEVRKLLGGKAGLAEKDGIKADLFKVIEAKLVGKGVETAMLTKGLIAEVVALARKAVDSTSMARGATGESEAQPKATREEIKQFWTDLEKLDAETKRERQVRKDNAKTCLASKEKAWSEDNNFTVASGVKHYSKLGERDIALLTDEEFIKSAGEIKDEVNIELLPEEVHEPAAESRVESSWVKGMHGPFQLKTMQGSGAQVLQTLIDAGVPPEEIAVQVCGDGTHLQGTITSVGQDEFMSRCTDQRGYGALFASGFAKWDEDEKHFMFTTNEVGLQKASTIDGFMFDVTLDNIDGKRLEEFNFLDTTYLDTSMPSFASISKTNTDELGNTQWLWKNRQLNGAMPRNKEQLAQEVGNSRSFIHRLLDVQWPDHADVGPEEFEELKKLKKNAALGECGLEGKNICGPRKVGEGTIPVTRFQDAMKILMFASEELRAEGVDVFSGDTNKQVNKLLDLISSPDPKKKEAYKKLLETANANYEKTIEHQVDNWAKALINRGKKYVVGGAAGCGWFANDDAVMAKIYAKVMAKYEGRLQFVYACYDGEKDAHLPIWTKAFADAGVSMLGAPGDSEEQVVVANPEKAAKELFADIDAFASGRKAPSKIQDDLLQYLMHVLDNMQPEGSVSGNLPHTEMMARLEELVRNLSDISNKKNYLQGKEQLVGLLTDIHESFVYDKGDEWSAYDKFLEALRTDVSVLKENLEDEIAQARLERMAAIKANLVAVDKEEVLEDYAGSANTVSENIESILSAPQIDKKMLQDYLKSLYETLFEDAAEGLAADDALADVAGMLADSSTRANGFTALKERLIADARSWSRANPGTGPELGAYVGFATSLAGGL